MSSAAPPESEGVASLEEAVVAKQAWPYHSSSLVGHVLPLPPHVLHLDQAPVEFPDS